MSSRVAKGGHVPRYLGAALVAGFVTSFVSGCCTSRFLTAAAPRSSVFGTHPVILLMPLAVQEMVMAIWLIAKGFRPGTIASESDRQPLGA